MQAKLYQLWYYYALLRQHVLSLMLLLPPKQLALFDVIVISISTHMYT
jgi:hypothetical protein